MIAIVTYYQKKKEDFFSVSKLASDITNETISTLADISILKNTLWLNLKSL